MPLIKKIFFLVAKCKLKQPFWGQNGQFNEETLWREQTGITFKHTDGSSGNRYIVESVTAGLALFDYDGDEDIDIYFLNGAPLQGAVFDTPPRNALYRNDGNWSFTDITDQSGLGDTGYGLGVTSVTMTMTAMRTYI